MVCIYCQHETKVTNTRERARDGSVWRRRSCEACVAQFSTTELPDLSVSIAVRSSTGSLAPFHRDTLFLSIHRALDHRHDAIASATALTQTVIGRLLRKKKFAGATIDASTIAHATLEVLKRFDPLSAHSYRAHHQESLR